MSYPFDKAEPTGGGIVTVIEADTLHGYAAFKAQQMQYVDNDDEGPYFFFDLPGTNRVRQSSYYQNN